MCGIVVAIANQGKNLQHVSLLNALNKISHRGPDNQGWQYLDNVFMGHARLSILDTSHMGNQPYEFNDKYIVYNGEVFNYIELKNELIDLGYTFESGSDTEVVLKAYDAYGDKFLKKLNGMWSIFIYDKKTRKYIVSRDRFGQKPLFYAITDQGIYFASEIQSLLEIEKFTCNKYAITSFLQEGSFDVGGNTFFSNVFEFPKASYATIENKKLVSRKYWEYPDRVSADQPDQCTFENLLLDSVEIRLRTDVNYSLLLSGGTDSTIISALTRRVVGDDRQLTAFCFSSGDKDDEVRYASEIANDLKINLHVSESCRKPKDFISTLNKLVVHLGRGHSSPAIVSVDSLYQLVQIHGFKIALDGQGADELLGGYKHYHLHLAIDLLLKLRFTELIYLMRSVKLNDFKFVLLMCLRNVLPGWARSVMRRFYGYEKIFSNRNQFTHEEPPLVYNKPNLKNQTFLNSYLIRQHDTGLTNLLYYGDIVAMINSVENRSPFMDHRLVDYVFSTNAFLKVRKGIDKAGLRNMPEYIRFKDSLDRTKVGFNTPLSHDLKKVMVSDMLSHKFYEWDIFNDTYLKKLMQSEMIYSEKFERFLFRLYQVFLWKANFA